MEGLVVYTSKFLTWEAAMLVYVKKTYRPHHCSGFSKT